MIMILSLFVLLVTMLQFSISENVKNIMSVSGDSITLDFKRSVIRYLMSPIVFCTFFIMIVALANGEAFIFLIGFVMFILSAYVLLTRQHIPHSVFYSIVFQALVLILLAFVNGKF